MIKQFDDNSYIEIKKDNNKVLISIAGRDGENPRSVVINVAELTIEEFKLLLSDVIDSPPELVKKKSATKKKTAKKKTTKALKKTNSSD